VKIAPAEAPEPQLEVRFIGREDWDLLAEMSGEFEGRLRMQAPCRPSATHRPAPGQPVGLSVRQRDQGAT
jgi:hypothetical protein